MRSALAAMRPAEPRHALPTGQGRPKGLNALGILAYNPSLTEAFNTFNGYVLFSSSISPRERELLVLRVASVRQCDYEWAQHSILARDAGLAVEEIKRVALGPDAEGWSERDRAFIRAVDELIEDANLSDGTWALLAQSFDEAQILDLVFTVGAYDLLAMVFRSFHVEIDDDLAAHELVVPGDS
jgi:AhpD family alkylhydroperoxidase